MQALDYLMAQSKKGTSGSNSVYKYDTDGVIPSGDGHGRGPCCRENVDADE